MLATIILLAGAGLVAQRFERILWLQGEAIRDPALLERARQMGFTAVSVSSAADAELPAKHGLRFYRDQLLGKGVLELRDAEFDQVRAAYLEARAPATLVRPACLAAPATLAGARARLGQELDAIVRLRPLAVTLGDEISVTRRCNPLDLCHAPPSLAAYRAFLQERFGEIAALNHAFGTSVVSFEHVQPVTADELRRRELHGTGLPRNLRPWAEHREFMDRQLADLVGALQRDVVARAPGLACGLTGLQPPSAYGGHDYALLLPAMTCFEAYDIGGARDLAACLAPRGALQLATVFPENDAQRLGSWIDDLLAHGMGGVIAWSSAEALAADGPTAYGRALERVFAELGEAEAFAGAELVRAPVWLVESQASVRAWWLLDSAADGATWINRRSSYEAANSTSLAARASWLRLLEDLGLQATLVPAADLARRLRSEAGPRVLVLGAQIALSDANARAIEAFVTAGGVVLADHTPGLYDEHLTLRPRGALDDLFGVTSRSGRKQDLLVSEGRAAARGRLGHGAAVAEAELRGALAEPAGAFHLQLEHAQGRGRAIYLNLAVCEYAALRLAKDRARAAYELRQRVRHVLSQAGVEPAVQVRGEGWPTCLERLELRARDGRRLLAVRVNLLDAPALLEELGARGPRPLELGFDRPVTVRDLRAGRDLGSGQRLTVTLDPWRAALLEVREAR